MAKIYELSGLSTSTKPVTVDIATGSTYTELDTGRVYTFNSSTNSWLYAGASESTATGIRDIRKTSTEGYIDTYTIYYTSGGETTFTVTNGTDGSAAEAKIEEIRLCLQKEAETRQTEDIKLGDLLEKVGLYQSKTNASKWESKEGLLVGYLGKSSGDELKGSISLSIEQSNTSSPAYPQLTGTFYSPINQDNSITGTLSLTPITSTTPFLSFTGTNDLSMGQRTLTFEDDWFETSDTNINLRLPAKSGTLITEADALGSLDIEVENFDVTQVDITQAQLDYLVKYPKSLLAIRYFHYLGHDYPSGVYTYFTKVRDAAANYDWPRFISLLDTQTIAIATLGFRKDDKNGEQIPVINFEYHSYLTESDTKSLIDEKIDKALDSYITWTEIE